MLFFFRFPVRVRLMLWFTFRKRERKKKWEFKFSVVDFVEMFQTSRLLFIFIDDAIEFVFLFFVVFLLYFFNLARNIDGLMQANITALLSSFSLVTGTHIHTHTSYCFACYCCHLTNAIALTTSSIQNCKRGCRFHSFFVRFFFIFIFILLARLIIITMPLLSFEFSLCALPSSLFAVIPLFTFHCCVCFLLIDQSISRCHSDWNWF